MNLTDARRLLDDIEPQPPLLPDGSIVVANGRCSVCGRRLLPSAPASNDHADDCAAMEEWLRLHAARAAFERAAPAIVAACLTRLDLAREILAAAVDLLPPHDPNTDHVRAMARTWLEGTP